MGFICDLWDLFVIYSKGVYVIFSCDSPLALAMNHPPPPPQVLCPGTTEEELVDIGCRILQLYHWQDTRDQTWRHTLYFHLLAVTSWNFRRRTVCTHCISASLTCSDHLSQNLSRFALSFEKLVVCMSSRIRIPPNMLIQDSQKCKWWMFENICRPYHYIAFFANFRPVFWDSVHRGARSSSGRFWALICKQFDKDYIITSTLYEEFDEIFHPLYFIWELKKITRPIKVKSSHLRGAGRLYHSIIGMSTSQRVFTSM